MHRPFQFIQCEVRMRCPPIPGHSLTFQRQETTWLYARIPKVSHLNTGRCKARSENWAHSHGSKRLQSYPLSRHVNCQFLNKKKNKPIWKVVARCHFSLILSHMNLSHMNVRMLIVWYIGWLSGWHGGLAPPGFWVPILLWLCFYPAVQKHVVCVLWCLWIVCGVLCASPWSGIPDRLPFALWDRFQAHRDSALDTRLWRMDGINLLAAIPVMLKGGSNLYLMWIRPTVNKNNIQDYWLSVIVPCNILINSIILLSDRSFVMIF